MHTNSIISFIGLLLISVIVRVTPVSAQPVLFDFNNAPLYTSLPIYQTAGGITAHLSATGAGYSIQNANVLGFTPPGFSGHILYPNSINLSDIRVHFDHILTDFSIMYCVQELGCDNSATMRTSAYLNGNLVGYVDHTAIFPGTWPVDTLRCHYAQGFDSVIVHYQAPPPTCQDYGEIYLADNMVVTPLPLGIGNGSRNAEVFSLSQNYPNPFNPSTAISYELSIESYVTLKVFDVLGQEIESLVNEKQSAGSYKVEWNASDYPSGVYFYKLASGDFTEIRKMVLIK